MRSQTCTIYPCFNTRLGHFDGEHWQCDGCVKNPVADKTTKSVLENFIISSNLLNTQLVESRTPPALEVLNKTQGLAHARVLLKKEKQELYALTLFEDASNVGVLNCLQKPTSIALSHDSTFPKPSLPLTVFFKHKQPSTKQDYDEVVLPALPFANVPAVSSSPGPAAHAFLASRMRLKEGDATLILGFD
ncbi:hypothetical protein COT72_03445 [archaeon CG10_big_fil_rev_8_21_14_0_10_43_11]|nr:MAG: hypothetical protein COT72_03445 [archaeon CG10_big_fil_rev_8_21_14_0_10_43_11]